LDKTHQQQRIRKFFALIQPETHAHAIFSRKIYSSRLFFLFQIL